MTSNDTQPQVEEIKRKRGRPKGTTKAAIAEAAKGKPRAKPQFMPGTISTEDRIATGAAVAPLKDQEAMAGKRKAFLFFIEEGQALSGACQMAGVTRRTINRWIAEDDDFRSDFEDACEARADGIEQVLMDAATGKNGQKLNILASFFLLKGLRRNVYGERVQVDTKVTVEPSKEFEKRFGDFCKALVDATAAQHKAAIEAQGTLQPRRKAIETDVVDAEIVRD
jgi:hypothetical protein